MGRLGGLKIGKERPGLVAVMARSILGGRWVLGNGRNTWRGRWFGSIGTRGVWNRWTSGLGIGILGDRTDRGPLEEWRAR